MSASCKTLPYSCPCAQYSGSAPSRGTSPLLRWWESPPKRISTFSLKPAAYCSASSCISATTTSASPDSVNRSASRLVASTGSENSTPSTAEGETLSLVKVVTVPTKPTLTQSTSSHSEPYNKGRPFRVTLAPRIG